MDPKKPGGGNKPQPYIPAGNGEHSGEYTNCNSEFKKKSTETIPRSNCYIKNQKGLFNPKKSKLVQKVSRVEIAHWGNKIPTSYLPNCVIKKVVNGYIEQERYYNEKGETYLEIHYTNHGNPKAHPKVPHIHRSKFVDGVYLHEPWEDFQ